MVRRGDKKYGWILERPIGRYPRRIPTRRENKVTIQTEGKHRHNISVKLLDNSVGNVGAADI
jgi:hypothetical protein